MIKLSDLVSDNETNFVILVLTTKIIKLEFSYNRKNAALLCMMALHCVKALMTPGLLNKTVINNAA